MPTYEYECGDCGVFDLHRGIAQRNAAASCPVCDGDAHRVIMSAPLLSSMATGTRTAHAINERAAHEPVRSSTHGPSCGCCKPKVTLPRTAESSTRSAGGRPWMISH
jgi:putative FmdB family regulatory protein